MQATPGLWGELSLPGRRTDSFVAWKVPRTNGRTRYWPRSWFLNAVAAMLIVKMALGFWLTYISIGGLVTGSWARSTRGWAYAILPVGLLLILLGAWFLILLLRPTLVLTTDSLRIPRGTFRVLDIPLSDITGIGLVFRRFIGYGSQRPPAGWYLTVWHSHGNERRLGIAYAPALWRNSGSRAKAKFLAGTAPSATPGDGRNFSLAKFDPASETDPVKLAATYAGRVAREIHDRVLAQQGPAGPMAAAERQKQFPAIREEGALAIWYPDGAMGRPGRSSPHHPLA
jgi:hypothetical protein